jgi:hypothetical protein
MSEQYFDQNPAFIFVRFYCWWEVKRTTLVDVGSVNFRTRAHCPASPQTVSERSEFIAVDAAFSRRHNSHELS